MFGNFVLLDYLIIFIYLTGLIVLAAYLKEAASRSLEDIFYRFQSIS